MAEPTDESALHPAQGSLMLRPVRMLQKFLLVLIRAYQRAISPLLGNVCRFEPSCSRYAAACIESHGPFRGTLLSVVRVCKCHPFHPGGVDLPPPAPGPRGVLRRTQKADGS